MGLNELVSTLKDPAAAISTIVATIVLSITSLYKIRTYLSRSRFDRADVFQLPIMPGEEAIYVNELPGLDTLVVGRQGPIREVCGRVRTSRLIFVYGESGSGKSTFLKLGVARELAHNSLPIYVDVWGTDWIRGPWKVLADSTAFAFRTLGVPNGTSGPITEATVFEELRSARERIGRRPVLIFDQLDDYLTVFRSKFHDSQSAFLLTPEELCAAIKPIISNYT